VKNYHIRPDIKKNTLHLKITEKLLKKEIVERLYTDLRFAVADLSPGFTVVADYSECTLGNLDSMPVFGKVMHYLVLQGVGEVVRVMPDPNLFYKQMKNMTARSSGYHPVIVSCNEEMETKLGSLIHRCGIRLHPLRHLARFEGDNCNGEGLIQDISISGCALLNVPIRPQLGEKIQLFFDLPSQNEETMVFAMSSEVVRIAESGFAVKYSEEDEGKRKEFWSCLVQLCQREIVGL